MSRAELELKELQAFSPELQPAGGLVQAADGYFYGVTQNGGAAGTGMIYRLSPDSPLEQVFSFAALIQWSPELHLQGGELNVGGANPKGTLIYSPEGCLYGFTTRGGAFGAGVVFRYDLSGAFSVIYDLDPLKGFFPEHLLLTRNGDLYLTVNPVVEQGRDREEGEPSSGSVETRWNSCISLTTGCTTPRGHSAR